LTKEDYLDKSPKHTNVKPFCLIQFARAVCCRWPLASLSFLCPPRISHLSLSQVIVQRTEAKVDAGASLLQDILKVGAEDDGEFLVPLSNAKAAGIFFLPPFKVCRRAAAGK
jgi:hypothetical protein